MAMFVSESVMCQTVKLIDRNILYILTYNCLAGEGSKTKANIGFVWWTVCMAYLVLQGKRELYIKESILIKLKCKFSCIVNHRRVHYAPL